MQPSTSLTRPVIRMPALAGIRMPRAVVRPFMFVAALVVIASATFLVGIRMAYADPTAVDAIASGATATNAGWDLVSSYGPLWGGLAVVLAVGQRWLAANNTSHVLAQGRLLATITGAVGVLGAVAQWKWTGAPSSGIVVTAFGAITLIWHPNVTVAGVPVGLVPAPTTASPAATTLARPTALVTLFAVLTGGVVLQPACTAAQVRDLKAVGQTIWDCTAPERAEAVALLSPLFTELLTAAASADGKSIDTSALKTATSASNLESDASVALECAKAKAFSDAMTPAPAATPGAPAAAGLVLDPAALRQAYERVRPARSSFILPGGKVL